MTRSTRHSIRAGALLALAVLLAAPVAADPFLMMKIIEATSSPDARLGPGTDYFYCSSTLILLL